jgi:hypothetical protein
MPRDLTRAIERIEERTFRKPLAAPSYTKPAIKPHADVSARQAAAQPRRDGVLATRSIQLKVTLAPEEVLHLPAPEGQPRIKLNVVYDGGTLSTEVATKSVRKAQSTIRAAGVEAVFVMLQGKLGRGEIREAGLVAQPKTPPKTNPLATGDQT